MQTNYRIFSLWRLLAALMVTAYHFCHYAPNADVVVAWWERMGPLLDMFFVLSGFLIFDRYYNRVTDRASYLSFLGRRLIRLYPLHLLTTGFFVLVGIAVHLGLVPSGGGADRYDFSALPSALLLTQAWGFGQSLTFNYVSWSLSAEWFAYVMFPLLLLAYAYGRLTGILLLLAVTVIGLEIADYGATDFRELWYEAKTWGAYRVFADFVYGAAICVLIQKSTVRLNSLAPAWIVMACAVGAMHYGANIYFILGLVGLAIYLGALAERTNPDLSKWMDPFMPVAMVAFGIYLWHPVIETLTFSLAWRYMLEPLGMPFWVFLPIPIALSVLTAIVSAHWFEVPMSRWLKNQFERQRDGVKLAKQN